jgi:membrane protease YdiL (CAAX protease family)
MANQRRKIPWLYLAISYAFAWLLWIPIALTGQDYQASPLLLAAMFLGVFGPGLAGIIVTYREQGKEGLRDFWRRAFDLRRIRARWYVVIVFFWPALHALASGINRLAGGVMPGSAFVRELAAQPIQLPVVVVLYVLQAWLEELGWRGYMLERVQPEWGSLRGALLVGILHAPWHLPTFWIVGTNQIEMGFGLDFVLFVVAAVAVSVYTAVCYNDNGRSTMAAALLHATGNLSLDLLTDGPATSQYRIYILLMALGAVAAGAMMVRRARARAHADGSHQGDGVVWTVSAPAEW